MKNITLAGNIGKSAELRKTGNGESVAGFSLAVNDGFGDKQRALWFDCSIWGKRAETLAPMLNKGGKVTVCGDLSTREHEGKTYLTVRVSEVTLQSGKSDGDFKREVQGEADKQVKSRRDDMDDAIPF